MVSLVLQARGLRTPRMEKKGGKVISGRNGTAARYAEVRAVREPVAAGRAEVSGRSGRARHRRRQGTIRPHASNSTSISPNYKIIFLIYIFHSFLSSNK